MFFSRGNDAGKSVSAVSLGKRCAWRGGERRGGGLQLERDEPEGALVRLAGRRRDQGAGEEAGRRGPGGPTCVVVERGARLAEVQGFSETAELLTALAAAPASADVVAVVSSRMESGGRKAKGLMNACAHRPPCGNEEN